MNIINLYENYNSYFNQNLKVIFGKISKISSEGNFKLYLIGGIVRDLLLNRENLDIDISVEGDAIKFAKLLQENGVAKISSIHEDFGTVKVKIEEIDIDLASTRSESYPQKGHLPGVNEIGCLLEQDVLRRDFTINSLAISLNEGDFAHLIDYVGGYEDLKNKKIRILHDKSFIDDPTRIIRALKYSQRFGFDLEENTLKLQSEYLDNINYDMCYKRVKQEIEKTFNDCGQACFEKFIEHGICKLITPHPDCRLGLLAQQQNIEALINKYNPNYPWFVYFGLILSNGGVEKFDLTKYEKDAIEGAESLKNKTFSDDFEIYKAFGGKYIETLLILAALGMEKEVCRYLDDLAKIKLQITGDDLIKLGFKPSKKFSEGFDYVLKEKLKNLKMTKDEEIKLAKKFLTD